MIMSYPFNLFKDFDQVVLQVWISVVNKFLFDGLQQFLFAAREEWEADG